MQRQVETKDYVLAGRIMKDDGSHHHADCVIPGKQRLHVQNDGGCYLTHLASPPPPGSWIGVVGDWVMIDAGPADGGRYVEGQVDATGWDPLPEGYHPSLDGDLQAWIDDYGWGNWV